jgi:hypothetical protein
MLDGNPAGTAADVDAAMSSIPALIIAQWRAGISVSPCRSIV